MVPEKLQFKVTRGTEQCLSPCAAISANAYMYSHLSKCNAHNNSERKKKQPTQYFDEGTLYVDKSSERVLPTLDTTY